MVHYEKIWVVLLLVSTYAFCDSSARSQNTHSNGKSQNSMDGFYALVIMTTDVQQALKNWEIPTEGFYMQDAQTVERGMPIEALVVFSGCTANEEGNCIAEIDYRIIKPDGSLSGEYLGSDLWRNKPVIPEGRLGLAVDRIGFIAEQSDQLGYYVVECVVRDNVANIELKISTSFEVTEPDD